VTAVAPSLWLTLPSRVSVTACPRIAAIAALSTTAQASAAFQSGGGAVPLFAAADEAVPAPSPLSAASPPHPASVSDAATAASMIDLLIP